MTYLPESEKYASSAVTRFRRSDFIAAVYALVFVLANFGIAIAARMPMITTTIRSSISVKPLRRFFIWIPEWRGNVDNIADRLSQSVTVSSKASDGPVDCGIATLFAYRTYEA